MPLHAAGPYGALMGLRSWCAWGAQST